MIQTESDIRKATSLKRVLILVTCQGSQVIDTECFTNLGSVQSVLLGEKGAHDCKSVLIQVWRKRRHMTFYTVYSTKGVAQFYSHINFKNKFATNFWQDRNIDGIKLVGFHLKIKSVT